MLASTRNWRRITRGVAPSALRRPISRIRSVTETSMMFMTPIPPTSNETAAIPPSSTVSVLLVEDTVASSDCWLLMVKSAVDVAVMPWVAESVALASWYAADSVLCELASR